ncbi:MAG: hypothetical protein ABI448_00320 [Bacteroidia bacterium]
MNTIKQTLFFNWNFMRVLRLGFGIFIAYQALVTHDAFSGLIAAFFLFQAVTNTGCCGSQGCSTSIPKNNVDKIEDVEFVEVKSDK